MININVGYDNLYLKLLLLGGLSNRIILSLKLVWDIESCKLIWVYSENLV